MPVNSAPRGLSQELPFFAWPNLTVTQKVDERAIRLHNINKLLNVPASVERFLRNRQISSPASRAGHRLYSSKSLFSSTNSLSPYANESGGWNKTRFWRWRHLATPHPFKQSLKNPNTAKSHNPPLNPKSDLSRVLILHYHISLHLLEGSGE
jgi:hypothetical protein